jgi:predicted metal-dependent hydrolase
MKFDDLDIEYRLSRSRKSIGLMVTTEGKVVVTLPRGTSKESLAQALTRHRAWIEAKVAERQAAWRQIKAGEAYLLGEAFRLTVLKGATGAVTLNGSEILVPLPEGADLWSRLVAWYAERAFGLLHERVRHFAVTMGLAPGPGGRGAHPPDRFVHLVGYSYGRHRRNGAPSRFSQRRRTA